MANGVLKKEKHSNVEFIIKSRSKTYSLYFTDQRNFGTITFGNTDKLNKKLNCLGPDLLKEKITFKILKERIKNYLEVSEKRKNNKIIKVLMSQSKKDGIGSGIGNYLAPEILYRAKISPHKLIYDIYKDDKLIKKLLRSIKYTLKLAYFDNKVGYMEYFLNFNKKHKKLIKDGKLPDYYPEIKIKKMILLNF